MKWSAYVWAVRYICKVQVTAQGEVKQKMKQMNSMLDLKCLSAWNDIMWLVGWCDVVYLSAERLLMLQIYYIQATRTHLCLTKPWSLILHALLLLWVSGIAYVCELAAAEVKPLSINV